MKLLFLGNGFDLASGLPTTYSQFMVNETEYIDKELQPSVMKVIKEIIMNFDKDDIYNYLAGKYNDIMSAHLVNDYDNNKMADSKFFKMNQDFYENIYISITAILETAEEKGMTFWDYYFYEQRKRKIENWSDIEASINDALKKFINKDFNIEPYFDNNIFAVDDKDWETFRTKYRVNNDKEALECKIKYIVEDKQIFDNMLFRYLKNKHKVESKEDFFKYLMTELNKLEKRFISYLLFIERTYFIDSEYASRNKEIYSTNLARIFNNDFNNEYSNDVGNNNNKRSSLNEYYLFNFNYTDFYKEDKLPKKNIFSFSKVLKNHNIKMVEDCLHGSLRDEIIFGIDQESLEEIDDRFIFSKTFRKMLYNEKNEGISLPSRESVSEIIFYGHSLSEADYSYFRSVFDFYEIYSSNVNLVFCYSDYRSGFREEYAGLVLRLLEDYSESMKDAHGRKNLSHKLLLESRLNLREVQLDKMER